VNKPQTLRDLTPARRDALHEMAKVNLAAAVVLGEEAGFDRHLIYAAMFSTLLATLHAEYRMTPNQIVSVVHDAMKPPA
jgi:hypothetical protein